MPSKSKLPPPPARSGGGRPLPPDPTSFGSSDAPPPLPSRPAPHRSGRGAPQQPPQPTHDSSDCEEAYEEPDSSAAPPPPVVRHMPPPPRGPVEEETYDACEIEQQEDEFEQEEYAECELKEEPEAQGDSLYEMGDVEDEVEEESEEEEEDLPPPPQEELIQEDTYEFVPGEAMTAEPTHPVPPVPPSLPSRPAPSRPMHRDASPEPVPERPAANKTKKVSGDGAVMLGISQNELANKLNRLKKISTSENSEPPPKQEVQKQETAPVGSSFQQRMALFKTAEKDDPEGDGSDLSSQIANARKSLKSRPQLPSKPRRSNSPQTTLSVQATPNIGNSKSDSDYRGAKPKIAVRNRSPTPVRTPPDFDNNENMPSLTIKQRMALISGIHSETPFKASNKNSETQDKPPLPVKPSKQPPRTPAKPGKTAPGSLQPKSTVRPYGYDLVPSRTTDRDTTASVQMKPMEKPVTPVVERKITPAPAPPPPQPPAQEWEQDDVYDDASSYVPPQDPLSKEEWYHGNIERRETESRLNQIGQDGTFLVRKSKQGGDKQPYTLVVLYQSHVYNLKVRVRDDNQVALGEWKDDELAFQDVSTLVDHHKKHEVILVNVKQNKQYQTLLRRFPIRINGFS
ncbi:B-cell linker protein-like isoform X1 [Mya arenaria]|uniref:B-cell linker protein-like isoform X1 n=1 Tax=Mya arenaria TaxID=6604 RepID=UPI0022E1A58A|nr:B-cell linker protein-like isoform X1 [Mya arenaria]